MVCVVCYKKFDGKNTICPECLELLKMGAEQGYASAQCCLGNMLFYGEGFPKNKKKAIEWYQKSAEQGNAYAQFFLAGCYYFADGVELSVDKSNYWYRKAALQAKEIKQRTGKNEQTQGFWVCKGHRKKNQDVDDLLSLITQTWQERFMERIWKSGKTEIEVYKKADMSKQHFSKIRSDRNYSPKKETVLILSVALELSLVDTDVFLEEAGYAFSDLDPIDVVVRDFISREEYDIKKINEFLFKKGLPLIGNVKNA